MDRAELERLDRDSLIARAEAAGVARARILTRPELVDELLLRSFVDERTRQRVRGFFGRARDLLTKVIERGLHLPDAVASLGLREPPASVPPPAALPTVTLAGIYAAQGHRDRATATLRAVLVNEPDHEDARRLLEELSRPEYVPPPTPTFEESESVSATGLDEAKADEPPKPSVVDTEAPTMKATRLVGPESKNNDVCAVPIDRQTLFICWHVEEGTLLSLRNQAPGGAVTVRVVLIRPTWDGPVTKVYDIVAGVPAGERLVQDLEGVDIVRVAIGWGGDERFEVISHSPALELTTAGGGSSGESELQRWTPIGMVALRDDDSDRERITRAIDRARARVLDRGGAGAFQ